jgi:hypothetical protein
VPGVLEAIGGSSDARRQFDRAASFRVPSQRYIVELA